MSTKLIQEQFYQATCITQGLRSCRIPSCTSRFGRPRLVLSRIREFPRLNSGQGVRLANVTNMRPNAEFYAMGRG